MLRSQKVVGVSLRLIVVVAIGSCGAEEQGTSPQSDTSSVASLARLPGAEVDQHNLADRKEGGGKGPIVLKSVGRRNDKGAAMRNPAGEPPEAQASSSPAILAPAAPQVSYHGGGILSNVNVVPVFWGSGVSPELVTRIGPFYSSITGSPYMSTLSEYSTVGLSPGTNQTLGSGSASAGVTISPVNTATILAPGDIENEIINQINMGVLPFPVVSAAGNTLYAFYFPLGKGLTLNGQGSCQNNTFCAYHDSFTVTDGGGDEILIAFSAIPDFRPGGGCDSRCGSGTMMDNVESVSSHELVEATTDVGASAWFRSSDGQEIGDLCNQAEACVSGFTVQKEWSNSRNACFAPTIGGPSLRGADAVVINPSGGGVVVRRSTGPSSYFSCNEAWTSGAFVGNVGNYFADVTGDGLADAIVVNSGQGVVVRRSTGNGFGPNETWTSGPFVGNVGNYFADVTGDGLADAIVVNSGQGVIVRRSTGNGFGPNETWTSGQFVGNVGNYFADVTGDGLADAIVVNSGQGVVVRRSNGSSFLPNETWTSGPFVGNVGNYFADVTGDGRADAIVVNSGQGVVVRRSTGSSFLPNETWTSGPFVGDAGNYFADVTGDGFADAIVVNVGQGVVVRRSTGSAFNPNEAWTDGPYNSAGGKSYFVDVDHRP